MATTEQTGAIGVVGLVQRDHRQIEQMLSKVEQATGNARQEAFEELVRKLAVHETAEEEVVHPLAREAGADDVADDVLREEDTAKKALAALDGMDVTSPDFDARFARIKQDVMAHAQHEEREEHPRILQSEPREKLERLASTFELAEKAAPTHPHAGSPESRMGNLMVGPILAVADRVRDAVRDAKRKSA
ncbi:MAG TPA: hemerythrin domain-containing protein [Acidimicrobiia bacterium]|nr:hemerythrin domain-containing protein [Acidimicrobiia bacterium]